MQKKRAHMKNGFDSNARLFTNRIYEQNVLFDSDFIWEPLLEQIKESYIYRKKFIGPRGREEKIEIIYEAKMKTELMEEGIPLKNATHIRLYII